MGVLFNNGRLHNRNMLSVIVPVYNTEKYINQCLDSLIGQTYKDIEIILVDDGSTDSSGSICEAYAQKSDRVKVIHKENGGCASAYMRGLAESKGDYIGFVDSDDWVELDMYEKMMSHFEVDGVNLVVCRHDRVYNGKCIGVCRDMQVDKIYDNSAKDIFFVKPTAPSIIPLSRCNKVYRKEDINQIIPYLDSSISFLEDTFFNMTYAIKAFRKVYFTCDVLYHYRCNPTSISKIMSDKNFIDMNTVYEKLKELDMSGEYLKEFGDAYIVFCSIALFAITNSTHNRKSRIKQIKRVLNHPNLEEAIKNSRWVCHSFVQKVKKFLIKHKMARMYLFANRILKFS